MMEPSQKCYDLIKEGEGLVLTAYKDPGSPTGLPITIGYGSTMTLDGAKFQLGDTITKEDAEELLKWEINNKAVVVAGLLENAKVNQNQFDALVSIAYNIGIRGFMDSTLLKRVKADANGSNIKDAFLMWIKNDGKVMQGLINRRTKEYNLYETRP